jgi:hypothetical protein
VLINQSTLCFEEIPTPHTSQLIDQFIKNQTPGICMKECDKCSVPPFYTIENVKNPEIMCQDNLLEELCLHDHIKSLTGKEDGNASSYEQAKIELLDH